MSILLTEKKDKSNEKIYFTLIFPNGLQLPIYIHPLKANQVQIDLNASDDRIKQECELNAFYKVLPILKEKLKRTPITVLMDSLYANEPVIELCVKLKLEYLIVRQVGSLLKKLKKNVMN